MIMNLLHDNNVFRNFLLEENSGLIHASQLAHYEEITSKSKFHVPVACCDKRKISSLARFGKLSRKDWNQSRVFRAPRETISLICSTNLMCSALSEAIDPLSIMGVKSRS